ncbi:MAG: cytochrome P450 [Chloroflexi bacterium]|jgi:cytochrome P450|nr:cytochrome P450 [Chloroflexota bacterium]MDP6498167.1 cytochrome P450 [Dehalococcoidia bacterium]MDP7588583.1 cytochrome P450 [Dehalococcoidia bacterium]MQF88649.1 cytochrome P450 [SAR202 cluster bacterium]MQG55173.1 cytochrome P450 [SAR202 cluster bacterium]|tara:strand:+ start:11654 stop:12877 length:1224 start_codon:yes stop_codon:yes gene_type:complete
MVTTINDDMFTPDVIQDPYRYLGQIRDEDPVHWNELYELWVITRHDDLVWLARNHEQFSNSVFRNDPRPAYPAILESDTELYDYVRDYQGDQFIQYDRPDHLEMRKVVHGYFTPKSMEEWRPLVKSAIADLLDAAEARGGGVDLMRDLAVPLPVLVIAEMMGVPESERPHIRMLAEKLLAIGRGEPDRMRVLTEGMQGMLDYVDPMVDERIVNPQDDFISVLASGEKSGVFSRHQVLVNTSLLLLAGHETTINLICNGTLAFMNNRDQWDLLKTDTQGLMVRATEEALRYDSPVKSIQRLASEDVEMRGKKIKKDDRIRWFMSSANRDPNKFENPDTMDITRWPNPHVAFGSGVHHCLGATIARVEGQEVFSALAERYPNLQLKTHDMEYQESITFRSIKSLPVSLN